MIEGKSVRSVYNKPIVDEINKHEKGRLPAPFRHNQGNDLLLDVEVLEHLAVTLLIIHFEVREKLPSASNLREKTSASGVVLLMLFQMFGDFVDLLREDTDLHLWGAGIFVMRAELRDELLLG